MMRIYKVGDSAWVSRIYWNGEHIDCPICFGNRTVRIVLGNGVSKHIKCSMCTIGFNEPTGKIRDFKYISRPEKIEITEVRVVSTEDKKTYEYKSGFYTFKPDELYLHRKDAEKKCEELAKEAEAEQIKRLMYRKEEEKRDMVYSLGYHRREIAKLRKQITMHERCIELGKENKPLKVKPESVKST